MAKYLDPKADLTFKKVFGEHKDLLVSFLNALLPLQPGKEIVSIEYLPPEMVPLNPDKKDTIVDVRCQDKDGRQFLVEMQMYWTDMFKRRTLYNTCKAYARPLKKGEDYREVKPIYTLSLINDIAFPEHPDEFYHEFVPTNRHHSDEIIEDFEMIFVELPKFKPSSWQDRKMAVLWLRFLTEIDESTKESPAELASDTLVAKALELVEESAYTDAELYAIEKYWDQISRERTIENAAERRGIEKGRAEGLEQGRAEGLEQGRAEGIIATARNFKALGLPAETIAQATGLTLAEVEAL